MENNQLTHEQRRLVEHNHNLIYQFLYDNNLPIDDNYGACAIALCQAAKQYNPTKGAFSTYAYKAMRNQIQQGINRARCKKRQAHTVSLDALRFQDEGCTNADFIPDKTDLETTCITRIALAGALHSLPKREYTALRLMLDGVPRARMAELMGCSHTTVWVTIKRCRDKLKAELG